MTSSERNKTLKPAGAFFGRRMMKFGVSVFIGVGKRTEKQSGARKGGKKKGEKSDGLGRGGWGETWGRRYWSRKLPFLCSSSSIFPVRRLTDNPLLLR